MFRGGNFGKPDCRLPSVCIFPVRSTLQIDQFLGRPVPDRNVLPVNQECFDVHFLFDMLLGQLYFLQENLDRHRNTCAWRQHAPDIPVHFHQPGQQILPFEKKRDPLVRFRCGFCFFLKGPYGSLLSVVQWCGVVFLLIAVVLLGIITKRESEYKEVP